MSMTMVRVCAAPDCPNAIEPQRGPTAMYCLSCTNTRHRRRKPGSQPEATKRYRAAHPERIREYNQRPEVKARKNQWKRDKVARQRREEAALRHLYRTDPIAERIKTCGMDYTELATRVGGRFGVDPECISRQIFRILEGKRMGLHIIDVWATYFAIPLDWTDE